MKRFVFNVAIKLFNIFVRQKMLDRLTFGTMEDVRKEFDAVIIITAAVNIIVFFFLIVIIIVTIVIIVITIIALKHNTL